MERRLAAILSADVVGYSRLVGADEEGTIARLKATRKGLFEPRLAEHHGRIVKLMGDGVLVEFASVIDAVRCAVEVQQAFREHNADRAERDSIVLRIGINVGDIVVEDDDIFGDGVNIAARLEGLAEPYGICVSGKVYDEVRSKLNFGYHDLGEQQVKNIEEPIRVYSVVPEPGAASAVTPVKTARQRPWLRPLAAGLAIKCASTRSSSMLPPAAMCGPSATTGHSITSSPCRIRSHRKS